MDFEKKKNRRSNIFNRYINETIETAYLYIN